MVADSPEAPSGKGPGTWFLLISGLLLIATGAFFIRFELNTVAYGEVSRESEVYLFSPKDGIVSELPVREGTETEQGLTLMRLDTWELEREHLQKRQELAEAEGELASNLLEQEALEKYPRDLDRLLAEQRMELLEQITVLQQDIRERYAELDRGQSRVSLEQARSHIEYLRTNLQKLETRVLDEQTKAGWPEFQLRTLQLQQARLRQRIDLLNQEIVLLDELIERSSIRAPIDGQLTWLGKRRPGMPVHKGEFVAKMSQPDSPYQVRAWVGERNLDLIKPGTAVRMESQVFDSTFEGYVHGEVTSISVEPYFLRDRSTNEEPRYEVKIRVDRTPYPLVLGSTLKTTFILGKQNIFLLLLNKAEERRESSS